MGKKPTVMKGSKAKKADDTCTESSSKRSASGGGQFSGETVTSLINSGTKVASKRIHPEILKASHDLPLLLLLHKFMSDDECDRLMDMLNAAGMERTTQRQTRICAHRDNDRKQLDSKDIADALWRRVCPYLPDTVDGRTKTAMNPNIRFYRYRAGQSFGPHVDDSYVDEIGNHSEYTMLIYLNGKESGLAGGETVFYGTKTQVEVAVSPEKGAALLHCHGSRCFLHEGQVVRRGEKYLMRSDAMYGDL